LDLVTYIFSSLLGNEAAASCSGQCEPGQGQDEERGGRGQQDPHRQEGRDGQGIQGMKMKMKREVEEVNKIL
jgi:hypothetical protein